MPFKKSQVSNFREATELEKSGEELLKLKGGRVNDNIPLNDPYWVALQKHNIDHGMNS